MRDETISTAVLGEDDDAHLMHRLDGQYERFQQRWDNLSQKERNDIRRAVLARSGFLREIYQRKLHSALVLAACLVELDRRRLESKPR